MENSFDSLARSWDENPQRIPQIEEVAGILERELQFSDTDKILDYGCGTGLLGFRLIANVGEVTFCDTSEGMLEQVEIKLKNYKEGKATVLNADFSQMKPFPEIYDKIFTMKVLHHVEDLVPLLKNFYCSLKPGGWLCCIDLEKEDGSFHNGDKVPHKGFERIEFENWLIEAGFTPEYYTNEIVIEKERNGVMAHFPLFVSLSRK